MAVRYPRKDAALTVTNSQSTANAALTHTYSAAGAGLTWVLLAAFVSFDGTPTAVTITVTVGSTTMLVQDVPGTTREFYFDDGLYLKGSDGENAAMTITVSAAGGTVKSRLTTMAL